MFSNIADSSNAGFIGAIGSEKTRSDRTARLREQGIGDAEMARLHAPVGIQMTPDGKRAFVANTNDNLVTVIDIPARKVAGTFTTGNEPDGMAWAAPRARH